MFWERYDVVVVGGGHAGAEASFAAATMGAKTLLITQSIEAICQMSCNPAMGGVAKGQIVREIDALGGMSGIITDRSTIQFRLLNRSKGPAMWSPRAQCDKTHFSLNWRAALESTPNLDIWQDEVVGIRTDGGAVVGVTTRMGIDIPAQAVILTNGTFLNGQVFIGELSFQGGRIGEMPATGLSGQLRSLGFVTDRLKTGTPVRVDGRSIDFSKLEVQPGDDNPQHFSFLPLPQLQNQIPCYIAHTNERTHDLLREGFDKSPLFTGRIQGHGPRYCPSIEDKIERFAGKNSHQLFVEPEGRNTCSYYLNGFSSSLPIEVQINALHSIEGFESARIFKPGYAIEYDYFPPTQLGYTLETKLFENLYFAGQINGTTGYEEAACQGLMAGINAVLKIKGRPAFVLTRAQAYIGVLIDDLVTKGVDEPYRMFTSRAEYRITLRQDNADERLTPLSHAFGLASDERMARVEQKMQHTRAMIQAIDDLSVSPSEINAFLESCQSSPLTQRLKLNSLILRPELSLADILEAVPQAGALAQTIPADIRGEVLDATETQIKYQRYIEKEHDVADRILRFENILIPDAIDYPSLQSLSYEAREKLSKTKPKTLGQASRISGVSPADISYLMIYIDRLFHEEHIPNGLS